VNTPTEASTTDRVGTDDSNTIPANAGDGTASLYEIVGRLDRAISEELISTGELAELRRLDVEQPDQPAYWKILTTYILSDRDRLSGKEETGWAMVLNGMAHMAPSVHDPDRSLGRVLADNDYHEMRLLRFLRERGEAFRSGVRRVARYLGRQGEPVDWGQFAAFILSDYGGEAHEELCRSIARDYYLHIEQDETDE
jgi:CRISPR type I-E-associated protein CasB/Cse2